MGQQLLVCFITLLTLLTFLILESKLLIPSNTHLLDAVFYYTGSGFVSLNVYIFLSSTSVQLDM